MDAWAIEMLDQAAWITRHPFLAALFVLAMAVLSFVVSLTVLVCLSPDYFATARAQRYRNFERGIGSWVAFVVKNLLGATLVVLGVVLSLPGMPGQGLLTIFAGILLLDVPGKRGLLFKMLSRPTLLQSINRLRAIFSRPPLIVG